MTVVAPLAACLTGFSQEVPRGGRVSWGRMITSTAYWNFHADRDPDLAKFIRTETTLNIDSTWYSVSPADLRQLCQFPFIYVKDLSYVRNASERENIGEYLARGGFLCIDACCTGPREPDMDVYLDENRKILQRLLPAGEFRKIPETDPIYHCYFTVTSKELYQHISRSNLRTQRGLFGMYLGQRLVAVVSMYGLECGWPEQPARKTPCMRMIVNIYVHAMTSAPEAKP